MLSNDPVKLKLEIKRLQEIIECNENFDINWIFHPSKNINDSRGTNELSNLFDCDVVIVASPNFTHLEYIQKFIENSKCHIFCEKPPVTSLDGIEYLENLSMEDKKRVFFNFNLRFSELDEILKQNNNSEKIGKIIQINIISSMGYAFKKRYLDSWHSDGQKNLYNISENSAIHWIDLMVYNFGESVSSINFPRLISKNGTSFDTDLINLKFKNELSVSIFASYATPLIDDIVILGTNGYLQINNNSMKIFYPRDTFDENGLFAKPKNCIEKEFKIEIIIKESLKKSVNFFLDCIKNSKEFDISYFNSCIETNRLTLNLRKDHI